MSKTSTQMDHQFDSLLDGKGYEEFSKLYKSFSTSFIKNILASVDIYIDLSPKEGFYPLLARFYYPNLDILANEPNVADAQSLLKNIENLGLENISIQLQRNELEGLIVDLLNDYPNHQSALIRVMITGNEVEEIGWITEFTEKFEKVKLIIEIDPELVDSKLINLQSSLEEIVKMGYEIWALDNKSNQFFRLSSQNIIKSIPPLSSYIFYGVKKSQALSMCFFSHSPLLGGTEKVMFELVNDLVKDFGVVCTAVLPRMGPQSEALTKIGVATLFAFPSIPAYGWWCDDASTVRSREYQQFQVFDCAMAIEMNVLNNLRKFDPDVIWTQSMVIPWGAKVAENLDRPHIWYVTEFGELDFGFKFFSPFVDVIEEIQATSNQVYTCSQVLKETLFPAAKKKNVSVLYACIPPPAVNTVASTEQHFLKKDSVKIGMFSQVRTTKGQEDAVLAISECARNGLNVELLIVGEAPDPTYLTYLRSLAVDLGVKDNIIFTGYSRNVFDLMALCDIVVMASRREAFGRVGVEAMLLNKPVVFANTGGISEYQLDGQTGLSYPPGDSLALAVQLKLLINDSALRNKMGIAGKLHASNLFSKKNFSERVYFDAKKIADEGRGDCESPTIIETLIQGAAESLNNEKKSKKFIGRNEVCPCNSGKKYKYCCGIIN